MASIAYQPRTHKGFAVALETDSGQQLTVFSAFPHEAPVFSGDPALTWNLALEENLLAYSTNEWSFRRAKQREKRKAFRKTADGHARDAKSIAEMAVSPRGETRARWCSSCFTRSEHVRVLLDGPARAGMQSYLCRACGGPTVLCAVPRCDNHAGRGTGRISSPRYCGEHRHEIPSFERMEERIESLEGYADWLKFDKANVAKTTRVITAFGIVAAVFSPVAFASASAIGGAIGSFVGLHGAAATSHGLALLGGGAVAAGGLGMAGGTAVVTATGAALGGALGAVVTTAYIGDDKSFRVEKLRVGDGAPVVLANGFLTEGHGKVAQVQHWGSWRRLVDDRYPGHPVYRVHWGSKELKALGMVAGAGVGEKALLRTVVAAAKRANRAAHLGALNAALLALGLVKNPWSVAKNRADMTGAVLADLIARSDEAPYILVGHSLGARVMATATTTLSTTPDGPYLEDVHVLGAAVGADWDWKDLRESTSGSVYNYWSRHDKVLQYLYRAAQAGQKAAGSRGFTARWTNVHDRDKASQVKAHGDYFAKIRLEDRRTTTSSG